MNKERVLYNLIIIGYIILLFCISNCLKIFGLTQPKIFGIFVGLSYLSLLLLKKIRNEKRKSLDNVFSFFILAFTIIITLSILINKKFELTNLFEIIRPIIYIMSVYTFTTIFKDKKNINFFNKVFYGLVVLLFIIGYIQFNNFGNINNYYIKTIAPTQYVTLLNGYAYPRIVGLLSNPNVYGFVLSLFNLYIFYLILKVNKENQKKNILLIILLVLNKLSLYFTGSRTSFLVSVFSELLLVFIYLILKSNKKSIKAILKNGLICVLIGLLELTLMFALPIKYSYRIRTIFDKNISSMSIRNELNNNNLKDFFTPSKDDNSDDDDDTGEHIKDNNTNEGKSISNENKLLKILFGKGPQKNSSAFDNEWIKILTSFGILGVATFAIIFIASCFVINKESHLTRAFYFSVTIMNFMYMITAGSYFSYNLFISMLLFIFLVYMGERNEE